MTLWSSVGLYSQTGLYGQSPKRRNDHQTFYCPVGHHNFFPGKSEAEKLREQLEAERQKSSMLKETARVERAAHEATKARLHRVENGVCPHCQRHFKNVERHMKSKHKTAA